MKKYISYLISVWLLITILAACADETTNFIIQDEQTVVTLQLSSKTLATRAIIGTEAGEDAWNENAMKNVNCFFYPNGKTNEAAVFSVTGITVNATGTATIPIKIPNDKIEALFGTAGNTCKAYVIVNRPAASAFGTDTSISGLKKTVIEAEEFVTQSSVVTAQESFVMDGEQEITLSSDRKSVTGHIDLYRAASKISLFITKVEETVTDEAGNEWTSQPDNMKVFFHNGVKKTHVDVSANGCAYMIQPEDYFNFSLSEETRGFEAVEAEDGSTEYYKHAPFYSYSSDWNNDAEHEAYLTLVVPWKKSGEGEFKSCYYQVPINIANKKFERNTYYKIKLSVGILGDFKPDASVELNPSYIIVDWGSGEVTADIKEYRYLVVDKNYVVMDNKNSIDVGYLSSHPITTEILSITKPNYSKVNESTDVIYPPFTGFSFSKNGGDLTLSHTLKNDNSKSDYDYVPYTIRVKVYHTDFPNIYEEIEYVQYPALYIKAEKNSSGNKWGDVFVNNNQRTTNSWNVVNGIRTGSGSSSNPNMYVVSISAFTNSSYIIADSRTSERLSPLGFTSQKDRNENTLRYYYPTQEAATFEKYISPKFRICSAYGRLGSVQLTREQAMYRCASYQEAGYPAGRWRVPTSAELQFMGKLCAEKKIPSLFTNGSTYWSASQGYRYNNTNGTFSKQNSADFVRCVYDEWYWTDTVDKDTFTWGDKQR